MGITTLSDAQLTTLQSANSPEEAAQRFVDIVTREMAQIVVDALDKALPQAIKTLGPSPAIEGWQNSIGGCAMTLNWERLRPSLPQCTIVAAVNRSSPTMSTLGFEVVGSVSVRGTF